jgi:hypothetical protein
MILSTFMNSKCLQLLQKKPLPHLLANQIQNVSATLILILSSDSQPPRSLIRRDMQSTKAIWRNIFHTEIANKMQQFINIYYSMFI